MYSFINWLSYCSSCGRRNNGHCNLFRSRFYYILSILKSKCVQYMSPSITTMDHAHPCFKFSNRNELTSNKWSNSHGAREYKRSQSGISATNTYKKFCWLKIWVIKISQSFEQNIKSTIKCPFFSSDDRKQIGENMRKYVYFSLQTCKLAKCKENFHSLSYVILHKTIFNRYLHHSISN